MEGTPDSTATKEGEEAKVDPLFEQPKNINEPHEDPSAVEFHQEHVGENVEVNHTKETVTETPIIESTEPQSESTEAHINIDTEEIKQDPALGQPKNVNVPIVDPGLEQHLEQHKEEQVKEEHTEEDKEHQIEEEEVKETHKDHEEKQHHPDETKHDTEVDEHKHQESDDKKEEHIEHENVEAKVDPQLENPKNEDKPKVDPTFEEYVDIEKTEDTPHIKEAAKEKPNIGENRKTHESELHESTFDIIEKEAPKIDPQFENPKNVDQPREVPIVKVDQEEHKHGEPHEESKNHDTPSKSKSNIPSNIAKSTGKLPYITL